MGYTEIILYNPINMENPGLSRQNQGFESRWDHQYPPEIEDYSVYRAGLSLLEIFYLSIPSNRIRDALGNLD